MTNYILWNILTSTDDDDLSNDDLESIYYRDDGLDDLSDDEDEFDDGYDNIDEWDCLANLEQQQPQQQ